MISRSIGENEKKYLFFELFIYFFIIIVFFLLLEKNLQCSLNILTLQFCGFDISAFPIPVLNLATFMHKHLLGHNVS